MLESKDEFIRKPLVGYAVLVIGMLLAVYAYTGAVDDNLRAGLRSSCERVNVLRAQSNLSDYVQWQTVANGAARERSLIKTDTQKNREAHMNSAASLEEQAGNLTVTGLTDCDEAVDSADSYVIPTANPIGDSRNIEVYPQIERIIDESRGLLQRENLRE